MTPEVCTRKWSSFKHTVAVTAREALGLKTRTHEDWFDQNDVKIKETFYAKNNSYT